MFNRPGFSEILQIRLGFSKSKRSGFTEHVFRRPEASLLLNQWHQSSGKSQQWYPILKKHASWLVIICRQIGVILCNFRSLRAWRHASVLYGNVIAWTWTVSLRYTQLLLLLKYYSLCREFFFAAPCIHCWLSYCLTSCWNINPVR